MASLVTRGGCATEEGTTQVTTKRRALRSAAVLVTLAATAATGSIAATTAQADTPAATSTTADGKTYGGKGHVLDGPFSKQQEQQPVNCPSRYATYRVAIGRLQSCVPFATAVRTSGYSRARHMYAPPHPRGPSVRAPDGGAGRTEEEAGGRERERKRRERCQAVRESRVGAIDEANSCMG